MRRRRDCAEAPGRCRKLPAILVTIAKFTKTARYNRLSEIDKMPYMKRLRRSSNELRAALSAGQITQGEYREAVLNGWMSRQLGSHGRVLLDACRHARQDRLTATLHRQNQGIAGDRAQRSSILTTPSDDDEDDFIRARIRTWPIETARAVGNLSLGGESRQDRRESGECKEVIS